ncbi:MAG: family 1 glycosylhydrolase [Anaerostipes hadrus]
MQEKRRTGELGRTFYNTNPEIWYDDVGPKKASDFYHHYKEDIKTMASFGMTGFRFTIQWARFMKDPIAGIVDNDAVEFYRDVIHEIKKNGMKPVISLEHWDIPAILFEKYNGWVGRETVYLYEQYVKAVLKEFHKEVKLWFAFTEPNIPIDNGYMDGIWYPFKHAPKKHIRHIFIKSSRQPKQSKQSNHIKKMDADSELCYI